MRPIALVALVALVALTALSALAQAPAPGPAPGAPAAALDSKLPLAAMRHQQPRQADVEQRETERFGPKEQEVEKQQRSEMDKLYDDVMRRSAPPAAGQ
ncbi:MAG: hypothetical protein ACLQJR_22760 [Stellaceae bacterium]